MTDLYTPSDEQVAVAWLKSCPTLSGVDVATSLAADASWTGSTFIQVTSSPLGVAPHPYFQSHNPRIIVSCWARPKHWNDAADTSQLVRSETYRVSSARTVTIPGEGYYPIRVMAAQTLGEPVRITGDPNNFSRYDIAIGLEWIPSNVVQLL